MDPRSRAATVVACAERGPCQGTPGIDAHRPCDEEHQGWLSESELRHFSDPVDATRESRYRIEEDPCASRRFPHHGPLVAGPGLVSFDLSEVLHLSDASSGAILGRSHVRFGSIDPSIT